MYKCIRTLAAVSLYNTVMYPLFVIQSNNSFFFLERSMSVLLTEAVNRTLQLHSHPSLRLVPRFGFRLPASFFANAAENFCSFSSLLVDSIIK